MSAIGVRSRLSTLRNSVSVPSPTECQLKKRNIQPHIAPNSSLMESCAPGKKNTKSQAAVSRCYWQTDLTWWYGPSELDAPENIDKRESSSTPPKVAADVELTTLTNSDSTPTQTSGLKVESAPHRLVGSLIETMIIERWPSNITFLQRNVFDVSRPFPIAEESIGDTELCGCQLGQCLLDASRPCINISTCNVCGTWNCSAGVGFGNRFEQSYQLLLVKTSIGYGVATESFIPAGDFVIEYTGEMLYGSDADVPNDRRYQVELPAPAGPLNQRLYIDALHSGNASRFINHSCDPNCEMYAWSWVNTFRLGIFAKRDIEPHTELCFTYTKGSLDLFKCQCGSRKCVTREQE